MLMDFLRLEGLYKVVLNAQTDRRARVFEIGIAGENREMRIHLLFLQAANQLQTVHAGHTDIDQNQAVAHAGNFIKSLGRAGIVSG